MSNSPSTQPYKARVLIVDDDYMICRSISNLLDYLKFKTDFIQYPKDAVGFLAANPDLDIILLDINLGQGVSGVDLLPQLREKNRYVQIIMFTSVDKLEVGVECMRRGAFDYMTKPFDERLFMEKAAAALERKKALQLNDVYLGVIVHDLKNPLQGITAGIDLLRLSLSEKGLDDLQKTAFHQAELSVTQILTTINNIVSISKFETNGLEARREHFVLQKEMENALGLFTASAVISGAPPVHLTFFSDQDITIVTDKDLFRRTLVNIVGNALRYCSQDKPVRVAVSKEDAEHIRVSVTNTGSFIEESARVTIFNKFSSVQVPSSQTGFQNFGLGLTFSRMAVEAMHGRIWIECDKAVPSTTFHFTLKNFQE